MASQNRDPAAASVVAARKGAEPSGGAARGSVGKRLQQELMTLMMSGDKGISAFPESDNLFKWIGTIHGAAGTPAAPPARAPSIRWPEAPAASLLPSVRGAAHAQRQLPVADPQPAKLASAPLHPAAAASSHPRIPGLPGPPGVA
ncbi:ubiquitin-conjugating enzyme E2 C [Echinops telfairi]|uniref:Ubiquitin-conjugating enzyme E2 C n=1 Tax=Echinops telfairi TaxID=9371 RepID=A0ABM0IEN4_ECHTE|nr:ubiquitin-conjugating enzyme E2 C [Echinops telfairi]